MQTITVVFILLALFLSFGVAFFQYFYKERTKTKVHFILFFLRGLAFFLLLLLWINPTIKITELENQKPVLSILTDNSKSISYFKEKKNIQNLIAKIKNDAQINQKFNIKNFFFDDDLKIEDTLNFKGNNTNVYRALQQIDELYKNNISPILLLTDGNQTIGNDFEYINTKQLVYPVVFGDTAKYKDLKISQLNVNKYSYINNKFPVEIILNYQGSSPVNSKFRIFKKNKIVFSKPVRFTKTKNAVTINTTLLSSEEGVQYYTAAIEKIDGEKNVTNNIKKFSVEVINEQTKVLLLTSVLHPDIGTLKKAIETNKQRSVDVFQVRNFKGKINDYQLIILFGLNNYFTPVIGEIKKNKSNFLLVSGTNSDWNFINKQQLGFSKKSITQIENYAPSFNDSFLTFAQKDIGFDQFPPLKDKFGEIKIEKEHQVLLYQNINGLETKQPLLATFQSDNQKRAVLFGEGIWRWRMNSFLTTNSFEDFDTFIGNFIQYLASNKKRERLDIKAETLFSANAPIVLNAFYTDQNYKFDNRASLEVTITNSKTQQVVKFPFSLVTNSYEAKIDNLPSGDYLYKVSVVGQNIKKYGRFQISDFEIEEQFSSANTAKLQKLASKSEGKLFYKGEFEKIKKELLENKLFYTIQKSKITEKDFISWRWLLFIIIGLFSIEWFLRKYHGKI